MCNGIVVYGQIDQLGAGAGWPVGHLAPGPASQKRFKQPGRGPKNL